jgi:hypothetical protein
MGLFNRKAIQETGFVLEDGPEGRTLVVTGDWTDRAAAALSDGVADGLVLNYARGYRERNLEFLRSWPLRRLDVLARTIKDIEPIYRMADTLQDLGLTTAPNAAVDCTRLPHLRSISVEDWTQLRDSLASANGLHQVAVCGYLEDDLLAFAQNVQLNSIRLKQAPRLQTLLGVEALPSLDNLQVSGAQRLHDLGSLSSTAFRLAELRLDTCGAVTTLEGITNQTGLRKLWVANCGNIESLRGIVALHDLELLYMWESTRIADGDLAPLLQLQHLRDLRLMNRKHYRPSVAQVKEKLGMTDGG